MPFELLQESVPAGEWTCGDDPDLVAVRYDWKLIPYPEWSAAMWACLLMPMLVAATPESERVLAEVNAACQTGSLIFSDGDCLAVKVFSKSRFTHVGAVVKENGRTMVYDSMNGSGVRQTELADYLRLQTPSEIQVLHPATSLTDDEVGVFVAHLKSQLGREYGIKHHLTGKRAKGVHCAEYCTDALLAANRIAVNEPPRVSPGSLYDGLTEHKLYVDGGRFELRESTSATPPPAEESWCGWAWRESWDCTVGCCRQMSRWFLCREKARVAE
jgi:hypothetical protein